MGVAEHLFSPELDALIAHHNRPPANWVYEEFPYDQKPAIVAWLRQHGLGDLADSVEETDPRFVGMHIAGYRAGYERERRFWEAFTGAKS